MENITIPEITYVPPSTLPEVSIRSGPSIVPLTLVNPPVFPIVVEGSAPGVPFVVPSVMGILPNQTPVTPVVESVLMTAEEQP